MTLVTSELRLGAELVEQPNAVAEEERGDVDLELVDQPGREVLLNDVCAARDGNVLVAGGRASLLTRSGSMKMERSRVTT